MTHPFHQAEFILQRLQEGFLPLLAPLPCHLASVVTVEYSPDFFQTMEEIPLRASPEGVGFAGEIPVAAGQTVQYRFRGQALDSDKLFYLNRPEGNCSFSLPATWSVRPVENPADEIYAVLDSGRVLYVRRPAWQAGDAVLVNLLGEHPLTDGLERGGGLLRAADLVLLLPADRQDAFLPVTGAGRRGTPGPHLTERLTDPALRGIDPFRFQNPAGDSEITPVLQRFDATYWFPVLGSIPPVFPEGRVPMLAVDLLAAFFATWLDALLIDGILVERSQK